MPKKSENSLRKNFSIPPALLADAEARSAALGYQSFSDYVNYLIAEDLDKRPEHIVRRVETDNKTPRVTYGSSSRVAEDPPTGGSPPKRK